MFKEADGVRPVFNGTSRISFFQRPAALAVKLLGGILVVIVGSAVCLAASNPTGDAVDAYVSSELQRQKIPGLALLVSRDGQPVRMQGYGLANVELEAPVKPETLFQSGSMGKQFTATAVMMLVEEGKLALDDPLTKFFPDAPASWKQVTVRN